MGTDATLFEIATDGTLTFIAAPTYIDGGDNTYVVDVTAEDAAGNIATQTITVTVVEADATAPAITGPGGVEGGATATTDVADGGTAVAILTADETVTWDVVGTDAALFEIATDGTLTFIAAPTYVAGGDNTYVVDVTAEDAAGNIATQTITVTVVEAAASTAPVVTSITGPAFYTDGSASFPVTVTFDEPVDGFATGAAVILGNGTLGTITPVSPDAGGFATRWTVVVTPIDDSLPVTVDVADNAVQDEADNFSDPSTPAQQLTVASTADDVVTAAIEDVLEDDLLQTTRLISQNASNIARRAADRLRPSNGQECGRQINELLQTSPVQFASGSFAINARNNALFDNIARILNDCSNTDFMIAGHTDSDASDAYNNVLSQNRVDVVRAALIQRGIAAQRLQARGYGEQRPIANNATEEGKALNRRIEFILLDTVAAAEHRCGEGSSVGGNLDSRANEQASGLMGNFVSEGYNCVTGVHTETWGELDWTQDDERGTTAMISFGVSKETQTNNTIRGRFVEGYASQNNVDTGTVDGTITGVGVHAGLYAAKGLESGLVVSYYGSVAVGQHTFDLNAGADVDGSYTYAGIFGGAAVTGERAFEAFILKPRSGIDLAYAQTIGTEISNTGTLDIEPATYARGFLELGFVRETGAGALEITPRVFCETTEDSSADACGFGGSIDFSGEKWTSGTQWDFAFDYETVGDRDQASVMVGRSQELMDGLGVTKSSLGVSATGALQAGQTVEFTW
jgi:outer membrane protein OmpA-like peptidoglycan-associated protein